MQLNVRLSDDDVATLDSYARAHSLSSRAEAMRQTVRLLGRWDLTLDYVTAFGEWRLAEETRRVAAVGDGPMPV